MNTASPQEERVLQKTKNDYGSAPFFISPSVSPPPPPCYIACALGTCPHVHTHVLTKEARMYLTFFFGSYFHALTEEGLVVVGNRRLQRIFLFFYLFYFICLGSNVLFLGRARTRLGSRWQRIVCRGRQSTTGWWRCSNWGRSAWCVLCVSVCQCVCLCVS